VPLPREVPRAGDRLRRLLPPGSEVVAADLKSALQTHREVISLVYQFAGFLLLILGFIKQTGTGAYCPPLGGSVIDRYSVERIGSPADLLMGSAWRTADVALPGAEFTKMFPSAAWERQSFWHRSRHRAFLEMPKAQLGNIGRCHRPR
jgi:hypothetical protein